MASPGQQLAQRVLVRGRACGRRGDSRVQVFVRFLRNGSRQRQDSKARRPGSLFSETPVGFQGELRRGGGVRLGAGGGTGSGEAAGGCRDADPRIFLQKLATVPRVSAPSAETRKRVCTLHAHSARLAAKTAGKQGKQRERQGPASLASGEVTGRACQRCCRSPPAPRPSGTSRRWPQAPAVFRPSVGHLSLDFGRHPGPRTEQGALLGATCVTLSRGVPAAWQGVGLTQKLG